MNYKITTKRLQATVDIIIPFHGHYHLLGECISGILSTTFAQLHTITIVDDCSPNKGFTAELEKDKLKKLPIQYIRHETQKGFGAALATGFAATHNPWVCFMHADCTPAKTDWLSEMVITMQSLKTQGVKLVSAKLDNGGTGSFDPVVIGDANPTKDVIVENALPLVCTLVNRQLFENIGGFVKPYPYGWYEDEELFWRMKIRGYKQAVSGKSFVKHKGGTTIKSLLEDHSIKKTMEDNKLLFINDVRTFAKETR